MKRLLSSDFFFLSLIILLWAGLTAWGGVDTTGPLELVRVLLGVAIVLFFPGYVIQSAVFPHKGEHDGWTRLVFSLGFSIIILPIIALVLDATPLGLHFSTVVASIVIVYCCAVVVATVVRHRMPEGEKSSVSLRIPPLKTWISSNRIDRVLQMILLFAAGIGLFSAAYMYLFPQIQTFTEFYLSDMTSADASPRIVTTGERFSILLGIINHEGGPSQYRIIAVNSEGQAIGETGPVLLDDGMEWKGELTMVIDLPGEHQEIEILLDRTGAPWPYRMLRLWITAVDGGSALEPSAVPSEKN